ncbi:hemopexin isoform X2 [Lampris incognitus]|uniref:hemopexin isoform X2 n=1 Tax=Lampris incognitus TaxID=2546036 RepID=UPI0024B584BC|nr:hemopexin isoform X2 [Lampris incognitus]
MKLLSKALCLCMALMLTNAAPIDPEETGTAEEHAQYDRCSGLEFDAITPDEKGKTFFFKDGRLWSGFDGPSQPVGDVFKELDKFDHVDAAFRMHKPDNLQDHDHIYFFLGDKVFSFYDHTLEEGYPKEIQEDFPGVPSNLDAAVECPKGECASNSVLFFKGNDVYVYDIETNVMKTKMWPNLPVCTSVLRWLEHHFCFHGHNFTKFSPVTGEVTGAYPKDARHYFMKCPNFGHGGNYTVPKCSEVTLDAVTSDDAGKTYAFRGPIYIRLDTHRDGIHAFPISRSWSEVAHGVDAVFSYNDKMYFIKGDQVYIYKSVAHYTLIEGYPKTLKEELGIEGPVNAAFACANENTAHIIQGNEMFDVDLSATPRVVTSKTPLPISDIEAGLCGPDGINVFKGSHYYHYNSPMELAMSKIMPRPLPIMSAMIGCQD